MYFVWESHRERETGAAVTGGEPWGGTQKSTVPVLLLLQAISQQIHRLIVLLEP